jgi:hypothetical protein
MTDVSGVAAPFLSALRTLPVWLLGGLAIAGYAVLFAPAFGGIDPAGFRTEWGVIAWVWAIAFSILAVARGLDSGVIAYRLHRKSSGAGRVLRFVPHHHQRWWHLTKQKDDSFTSQISLDVEVANLSDRPVRLIKVRLIRPRTKGDPLHADATLPMAGSPYHSHKHPVPPHQSVRAHLHILARGALAKQGRPIRVTVGITDQFGYEYKLKGIRIPTSDRPLPKLPWKVRLVSHLRNLPGLRPKAEPEPLPPPEWEHQGKFEEVDLILKEEKRAYAAKGRIRGGLGSLNVGLQSEPNFGWTEEGRVPALLWDKSQAKPVESPNATRLIKLHDRLDDAVKADLERYLLSHLHKRSAYAEVGYFIFFVLHRIGRTVDALRSARAHLAGDKVYGYSNVLGTLSAIISREHFDIRPDDLSLIAEALAGDTEHNFRLTEKINLARLQQLDL